MTENASEYTPTMGGYGLLSNTPDEDRATDMLHALVMPRTTGGLFAARNRNNGRLLVGRRQTGGVAELAPDVEEGRVYGISWVLCKYDMEHIEEAELGFFDERWATRASSAYGEWSGMAPTALDDPLLEETLLQGLLFILEL
jgi:hypothetical protein